MGPFPMDGHILYTEELTTLSWEVTDSNLSMCVNDHNNITVRSNRRIEKLLSLTDLDCDVLYLLSISSVEVYDLTTHTLKVIR